MLAVDGQGSSLRLVNSGGRTILFYPTVHNRSDLIRVLVEQGADLDQPDIAGLRAVHNAVIHGSIESLCTLINLGANIHLTDEHGRTALHYAALNGQSEMVSVLHSEGADLSQLDGTSRRWHRNGYTPEQLAKRAGHRAIARLIIQLKNGRGSITR